MDTFETIIQLLKLVGGVVGLYYLHQINSKLGEIK